MVSSHSRPIQGFRVITLLVFSILLMWVDHRTPSLDTARRSIGTVLYPLQIVVDSPVRLWNWLAEVADSNEELRRENNRLHTEALLTRGQLQTFAALEAENERLRTMLNARNLQRSDVRVAEIMAAAAARYRHSVVLAIGTWDGAYDGQSIIDANGVVGQIIEVGLMSSTALLISDPDHAIPVVVNRNGLRTVAFGTGQYDRLSLPFLTKSADIRSGDLLVTSGFGGAFPAGHPVAVVDSVIRSPQQEYAQITATPSAALDQVREVMLVQSPPGEVGR